MVKPALWTRLMQVRGMPQPVEPVRWTNPAEPLGEANLNLDIQSSRSRCFSRVLTRFPSVHLLIAYRTCPRLMMPPFHFLEKGS